MKYAATGTIIKGTMTMAPTTIAVLTSSLSRPTQYGHANAGLVINKDKAADAVRPDLRE